MAIVVYKDNKVERKDSWITYLLNRIESNQNNLIVVTGKTGKGKTWTALSICELISARNGVPFGIDNQVFTLKEMMALINSNKLSKGSCIVFDEPQCSISNREFQSEANKVFNYLLSTFRHRNLTLFFCTPYEDLLDLSCRKLFHFKFTTKSIDKNNQTCKLRPVELDYNSNKGKFYEHFLRVAFKPEGHSKYKSLKLYWWNVPKPSDALIKVYEAKKLKFTTQLNLEIEKRLDAYEAKQHKEKKLAKCKKCGHQWIVKTDTGLLPQKCPSCQSKSWNIRQNSKENEVLQ